MTAAERKDMIQKIQILRIPGFIEALESQATREPELVDIPFEDRLSELVDAAVCQRIDNRTNRLVRRAHLPVPEARVDNIDLLDGQRLNSQLLNILRTNSYIEKGHNVIICGAAGSGKTYIANALGRRACEDGFPVLYYSCDDLFEAASVSGESNIHKLRKTLDSARLLILDEFLLSRPTESQTQFLFNLVAARSGKKSTIFCTHYSFDGWYARLGGSPLVESILDRIGPSSYRLPVCTDASMRVKYESAPVIESTHTATSEES